jgi:glutamine synthetase
MCCWGLDNRTVLARCVVEPNSSANRVEFRSAGADANPYLVIAAILAAGADGIERGLELDEMGEGDMYGNPGDRAALPTDLDGAIDAYDGSELAGMLGDVFSRSYVSIARAEAVLGAEHSADPDDVNDWERERYREHT